MTGRDDEVRVRQTSGLRVHRILVVAAMARETAALRRMLARRGRPLPAPTWAAGARTWRLEGGPRSTAIEVAVTHCGVGAEAVRAWLDTLGPRPEPVPEILIVGYAGGLDPVLGVGAVVWPARGGAVTLDEASSRVDGRWGAIQQGNAADLWGSVWSVARPVLEPAEKDRLWLELGRPASALVDMETAEIMAGLRRLGYTEHVEHTEHLEHLEHAELLEHTEDGVRVCRVVTDAVEERLPPVICHVRADGSIAPARLMLAFLRRPSTLVALVRLAVRARRGSARLAAEVESWLAGR